MKNQVYTGTPTSRRFALCPTTVKAGDPVLLGVEPAVALNDYSSATGGSVFLTEGTFSLTVIAGTVVSPITGSQVNPGDKLYCTGSLDSGTNVTTTLVISKASGGTAFGIYDPSATYIASAATSTSASVKLGGY